MDFAGKNILITGGGKGIGRAIALEFAAAGANVIVTAREQAALDDTKAAIAELDAGSCLAVSADLTDPEAVAEVGRIVMQASGAPDVIVTAAGLRDTSNQPVSNRDPMELDAMVSGNLRMSLLPVRAFLPAMMERKSGRIVMMSGVFGIRGRAGHATGVTSKWAIEGLLRTLALELGPSGITVNAVCPGYVQGDRFAESISAMARKAGTDTETARRSLESQVPLGRLSSEGDIAAAVMFLAGDGARNITGQDIVVDGGWSL